MKKTVLLLLLMVPIICIGQNNSDLSDVKLSLYDDSYNYQKEIGASIRSGASLLGVGASIFTIGTIIKVANDNKEIKATTPDGIKTESDLIKGTNTVAGVIQIVGAGVIVFSAFKFAKAGKLMSNQKNNNQSYLKPSDNGVGLAYVF